MTGKPKRETLAEAAERWRERGRIDARMKKKPVDESTLLAVGGEVARRAYLEGYGRVR